MSRRHLMPDARVVLFEKENGKQKFNIPFVPSLIMSDYGQALRINAAARPTREVLVTSFLV